MSTPVNSSIITVADLVNRPGASRRVDLVLPVPEDLELPLAQATGPAHLSGVLESVVEGILVRGRLSVPLGVACARCLRDVETTVEADVAELFSDPAELEDPDDVEPGYELQDTLIDVDTLLRDALVPAVPYQPLCDAACRGLCATCGANHNEATCGCAETETEANPRWAQLKGLHLPDERR